MTGKTVDRTGDLIGDHAACCKRSARSEVNVAVAINEAGSRSRPRVYLAGPDVFLPNAREVGSAKKAIVARHGLTGVFPLDAELKLSGLSPDTAAARIARANEDLMRSCDAMIANLAPFRGVSMDSGTAFEVGFMRALGRPIEGYSSTADDYAMRARAWRSAPVPRGAGEYDRPELDIEDFGLAENLMIAIGISDDGGRVSYPRPGAKGGTVVPDQSAFEAAVDRLASRLQTHADVDNAAALQQGRST
ncbi:MAG: nucleoside 2-deoxyribosyltransferase [Pseudomonadota bacterium]